MSDRIFSVAWLCVCAIMAWQMWHLVVPFAYEPVGPKAFPLLLAGLMTVCCIFLMASPDADVRWPPASTRYRGALTIVALMAYALLFEPLGFPLATLCMVAAIARIFGASARTGAIAGIAIGGAAYVLFDVLLEVSLPRGTIFG